MPRPVVNPTLVSTDLQWRSRLPQSAQRALRASLLLARTPAAALWPNRRLCASSIWQGSSPPYNFFDRIYRIYRIGKAQKPILFALIIVSIVNPDGRI